MIEAACAANLVPSKSPPLLTPHKEGQKGGKWERRGAPRNVVVALGFRFSGLGLSGTCYMHPWT